MNPNNWFTVGTFIVVATLLSTAFGQSVKQDRLPLRSVMAFSDRQWQFIKIWVNVALLIGIVIPAVMSLFFWHTPVVNRFFACYLLVIIVQLGSEITMSRILCKSVVVIIGTLYTGFRVWQLGAGLELMGDRQPWLGLLWLVLLFWVANLVMLITQAIPSILPNKVEGEGDLG